MVRYHRCYACDGTRYELVMGEEICPQCVGTGRDLKEDLWAGPCGKCNNSRKVTYCRRDPSRPCRSCNGTGTVAY